MSIIVTRISVFRVKFHATNSLELKKAKEALSLAVEGAWFSEAYRNHDWDGIHIFYNQFQEMDFGLSYFLKDRMEREGVEVIFVDFEKYHGKIDISGIKLTDSLWEHQQEAVTAFFKEDFGCMVIPTRGGKTFTTAECIRITRLLGYKTSLFIVDGIDLFDQTVEEFSRFFGIPMSEIGQLREQGAMDFKEINVATVQTISSIMFPRKNKVKQKYLNDRKFKMRKFLSTVDFLAVDEIQEYSSDKRIKIIKDCRNISFGIYLSATPYKSEDPIANMKIIGYSGKIAYTVPEKILKERGVLVKDEVYIIVFEGHKYTESNTEAKSDYNFNFDQFLIKEPNRNSIIVSLMQFLDSIGRKTLVTLNRKDHGRILSGLSNKTFVSGDDDKDYRKKVKEYFLKIKGGVIIATNIYKKGVSLNSCEVLFNVGDGKEQSAIIQKRGRVLASSEGKTKSLILDIFDNVDIFKEHCLSRLEAYEKVVGSEGITVFYSSDPNFLADIQYKIESYFND